MGGASVRHSGRRQGGLGRAPARRAARRRSGRKRCPPIAIATRISPQSSSGGCAARLPPRFRDHAEKRIEALAAAGKAMATRKASQVALEAFAPVLPELVGGSADLTGSNNTLHKHSKPLTPADASGNYLYYGVREFGMAAMMNGLAAHGGVIPYGGTFLVFSDYARNASAHGGADRAAQHFRAHARFDRARRGRPHASADRASCEPALDAEHGALAAVRHRRDGRRLGSCDRAA